MLGKGRDTQHWHKNKSSLTIHTKWTTSCPSNSQCSLSSPAPSPLSKHTQTQLLRTLWAWTRAAGSLTYGVVFLFFFETSLQCWDSFIIFYKNWSEASNSFDLWISNPRKKLMMLLQRWFFKSKSQISSSKKSLFPKAHINTDNSIRGFSMRLWRCVKHY